jgi:hypothetical protein
MRSAHARPPFPLVLGPRVDDRLPLHVRHHVRPVASERHDVAFPIAGTRAACEPGRGQGCSRWNSCYRAGIGARQRMVAQPLAGGPGDHRGSATGGQPSFDGTRLDGEVAPKAVIPLFRFDAAQKPPGEHSIATRLFSYSADHLAEFSMVEPEIAAFFPRAVRQKTGPDPSGSSNAGVCTQVYQSRSR